VVQTNIEPQADDTINTTEQPLTPDNNTELQADNDTKSIQRKVGEITQYISSHKDETLAKYVVGMVNSIAGKYLTPEDKQKAIDKLNKATVPVSTPAPIVQQENPVAESVNVDEIIDEVLKDKHETSVTNKNKNLKNKIFNPLFK
jgi:hypothetical protein